MGNTFVFSNSWMKVYSNSGIETFVLCNLLGLHKTKYCVLWIRNSETPTCKIRFNTKLIFFKTKMLFKTN